MADPPPQGKLVELKPASAATTPEIRRSIRSSPDRADRIAAAVVSAIKTWGPRDP
jgi:hypothetical protein